ncbi:LOW QUALITY PROTEIN: WD repeat-containing protein 60 [Hippocampus comes]|uniref:LOW QUALITY PROTEIN: WD repeat-containing protein 60 n=1 Tax=Hippocampus comes TaxID=109280 RepID=UPI00094EAB11|nr:PREDICTED: LOW QUALITY PROTEIN: WD repeat-containing protein 60 [Hippocampus comes]
MHHEKKISMEDTWSAAELKRLLSRRKEPEHDRKHHRGGDSTERRPRDSRGERDHRDHHGERRDYHAEERRGDRDRRSERDRLEDTSRHAHDSREDRDKRDKRRPREGQEKEEDRLKRKEDTERRREERDKERRREERDKERRREERERRRHEERRDDQDRRERHEDRKHSRDEREYRKQKEERERRHKEREYHVSISSIANGHHPHSFDDFLLSVQDERLRQEGSEQERIERERQKERRRREDAERHHSSSKESKPSHSHEAKTKKTEENVMRSENVAAKDAGDTEDPVAKNELSHEYEEDFEKADYEEDFEELDEDDKDAEEEPSNLELGEEVKAIQKAMGEENERVRASFNTLSKGEEEGEEKPESSRVNRSDEKDSRCSQRGKFIDFVAAKQREVSKKLALKQKKRSAELLRLIDLDFSTTISLLDLPPISEYDMYIRNFGAANTKQAYVQCNEENADRDVQTEEVETSDKWTQHPTEHGGACGDPNRSHEIRNMSGMNFDSRRLAIFLRTASQVMAVLLEEDHAERSSFQGQTTQTDGLSFSDGSVQLNTDLPFLRGRTISQVLFSQAQRHTLLSVHKPPTSPVDIVQHHDCTTICVWNMWEPSRPQKILLCESEVQCCCFSPGKATLVFAGTSVGSVALWDLHEPAGNHQRLKLGDGEWTFRRPTFSTDAVPSAHFSAVTSVEVVPTNTTGMPGSEVAFLASEEELLGLSFQLASQDDSGLLNLWVVVQLPKANEAGSQTDLGLRPGGKVKLLHSSACVTAEGVSLSHVDKTGPPQSLHLKFLPTDPSHFFVGTNLGLVSHGTTQGLKALPKCYTSQELATRLVDVTAIHFSPFRPQLFLVGCGDGSLRLHEVSHDKPAYEWMDGTAGEAVVSLQWSQTRPAVFCVLDASSRLHVWDLLKSDTAPVVTEHLDEDRLTAMAAFGDPGQQNTYSGIATAHQSGKIEMHYFAKEFTIQSREEEKTFDGKIVESF